MKVVGLRIEKYIDKSVSGHDCDFKYGDAEFERHVLCCVSKDNLKVEITLRKSEGECGSGWCCASWGHLEQKIVDKFNGYNYIPKDKLYFKDSSLNSEEVRNNIFSFSCDGGDGYYPSGGYNVNMELFQQTDRIQKLRPVWIFKGGSNTGKSFLASKINGLDVYETDGRQTLPETITESIIVLGNRYKFTVEEIKKRIFGEFNLFIVEFK